MSRDGDEFCINGKSPSQCADSNLRMSGMRDLRIAVVAPGEIFGGAERQILVLLSTAAPQLRDQAGTAGVS